MAGQVTATGCLQRDSSSSTSADTSAAAGAGGGFVLKNAKMGGAGSSMSSGPAASTAPDASGRAAGAMSGAKGAKDINLMADASVNLAPHVGHQIMVTGRMAGAGGAATDSSAAPSASASSSPSASSTSGKGGSFTVTKVSMISATCSTGS